MNSHASRFRPQLEALTDRVVPSCTWVENGNVLTITGSQRADDIEITDDGTTLTITCDGDPVPVSANVTDIVIHAGNGNDTVNYTLTPGATAVTRTLDVRLGNGDDTFTGTVTGNLADGSALDVTAHGCNGKDTMSFADSGDVGAGAKLSVALCGGNGKDAIDTNFAGVLLGDLTWDVRGGNGKDELSTNMTFNAGSTGTVDAKELGWNAPDTLTMLVTDNSGDDGDPTTTDTSTLGTSTFVVDGGHSHDSFDVSDIVQVLDAKHM
jgi:hypothetical protein